jgi:hypothetical protein
LPAFLLSGSFFLRMQEAAEAKAGDTP